MVLGVLQTDYIGDRSRQKIHTHTHTTSSLWFILLYISSTTMSFDDHSAQCPPPAFFSSGPRCARSSLLCRIATRMRLHGRPQTAQQAKSGRYPSTLWNLVLGSARTSPSRFHALLANYRVQNRVGPTRAPWEALRKDRVCVFQHASSAACRAGRHGR